MRTILVIIASALLLTPVASRTEGAFEKDIITTTRGDLEITFIGHGSLMMKFSGKTIYVDPFSRLTDYSKLPKADLVIITHDHADHCDPGAIASVRTDSTVLFLTAACAQKVKGGTVMKNGDVQKVFGVSVDAVPAYNIVSKRPDGSLFHPKGEGNGYVFTFGTTRVYVAGDTENTPEMKALKNIDVAFLPMNLPYTMTPDMVADAARAFRPKILYPYHYGETDTAQLTALLKDSKEIAVRIRKMK